MSLNDYKWVSSNKKSTEGWVGSLFFVQNKL